VLDGRSVRALAAEALGTQLAPVPEDTARYHEGADLGTCRGHGEPTVAERLRAAFWN
jgi:hypothetical protein